MSQSDFRIVTTRTPIRITFTGGGTDFPQFFKKNGLGAVVSATINKYIYITVARNFYSNEYRISYSKTENAIRNIDDIQHPTVREALRLLDIRGGIQIISITEIPSKGTGLGSSSSFLVGLLLALHTWLGEYVTPKQLAEEAYKIEREILKEPGGMQDQYMAAFGGINLLKFTPEDVEIIRLPINQTARKELESNLIMFYTGRERNSSSIHIKQINEVDNHFEKYRKMVKIALDTAKSITEFNIIELGRLLKENWELKKTLSDGISDSEIDRMYEIGLKAGALGGKLMGAGGGGFMLFLIPKDKRQKIIEALSDYRVEPFAFEPFGARVIYTEDY